MSVEVVERNANVILGRKLRELRVIKGLSVRDVSVKMGRIRLTHIELGHTKINLDVLEKLLNGVYGVTLAEFFIAFEMA